MRTFVIDRAPEDWGDGRSRIFAENRTVRSPHGGFEFTPRVVLTASIEDASVVVDTDTGERLTPPMARAAAETIANAPSMVGRRVHVEAVAS
ncbi:hypothetical protein OEB99_16735 [Actinotalea sp. M2MS4P-6]|uniref:hypothetical protein n=1 Tax=Actinotalea sp. M2MS4P-6 TaxID=2983762 RepID=UPI0021E50AD8|nr:hypothetical protein [Actinotalea sp. M2MS4P-6]MCV2395964.1 hypothetical protein [Actinotalea sp. M2MS4P-6]